MKLGTRIFLCSVIIFAVCFYYPINWVLDNQRIRYLEGVEDPLVDQANILAALVGSEMENGKFDSEGWYTVFEEVSSRFLSAKIYDLDKNNVDLQVYITDAKGKIVFDSRSRENIGEDYSKWRDVRLTLDGQYGARSTRKYEDVPTSSVLFVAAPIRVAGEIAGVLTVAKPTTNINNFIEGAKPKITRISLVALLIALLLSLVASIWITRPIKRLTTYAIDTGSGRRTVFPRLDCTEIGDMGKAFEKMQEALEGKRYVEQYIQNLTHEIKSPLSAIRGAAELLDEEMPRDRRTRFMANIRNEAGRIQEIVDRMLQLTELESLKELQSTENVSMRSLVRTILESKQPMLLQKQIEIELDVEDDLVVQGDSFLLFQAVSNLIQNAIDFSPRGGQICLRGGEKDERMFFSVLDQGPGIPEYAGEKIFDKFFSLQRPDSDSKSTGLGLCLVREVANLHNGKVALKNREEKGARAELVLPARMK